MALVNATIHATKAGAAAAVLVFLSYLVETATYKCLIWLEKLRAIERLAPQIPTTITSYQRQTVFTFFFSAFFVNTIALLPSVYGPLMACAKPSWNVFEIAATCWFGVAAHDLWFFLIHTVLHKVKWLYRWVHVIHHKLGGDLTVFGTADMDVFEAIFMVFGFYATVLVTYVKIGYWNPIAYTFLVLLEANMNMMGHCGYRQPLWLALIQSWGICLTPGSAHAKTHYIHHLDPRVNRALYFSWWDRIAGTFKDKHPHIKEFTRDEQIEYETRAFRLLWAWLKQRTVNAIKAA